MKIIKIKSRTLNYWERTKSKAIVSQMLKKSILKQQIRTYISYL